MGINRRSFIGATSLTLSSFAFPPFSIAQLGSVGRWQALANLPYPVQEIYPAIHAGKIYVAGGFAVLSGQQSSATDQHICYNVAADTWETLAPIPEIRHHPNLVAGDNRVFALGGFKPEFSGTWVMQNQTWVYDIENNQWSDAKPAPELHGETVCLAFENSIHVIGGRIPKGESNAAWGDHTDSKRHLIYNTEDDSWHSAAPAINSRNSAAGAVVNGLLYVVGGRTVAGGNVDYLEVYDPQEDKWRLAAPMPQAQGGLGAANLNNQLIAFGGEYFGAGGRGVYKETWHYDSGKDQWSAIAPMPTPRHGLGAVSDGARVYAIAGATQAGGNGTSAALESFSF
jgi:N-acetylneuraminic acid mutarotase